MPYARRRQLSGKPCPVSAVDIGGRFGVRFRLFKLDHLSCLGRVFRSHFETELYNVGCQDGWTWNVNHYHRRTAQNRSFSVVIRLPVSYTHLTLPTNRE